MGIYSNGDIFGIQIYTLGDENTTILFEETYNERMTHPQMREAFLFYDSLPDKNNVFVKIYTECSSTLCNVDNFMMWYPLHLDIFLQKCSG